MRMLSKAPRGRWHTPSGPRNLRLRLRLRRCVSILALEYGRLAACLASSSTTPALRRGAVHRHGGLFESAAVHSSYRSTRLPSYGRPLRSACLLRSPRPTRSARYPFRYSMVSWLSQAGRHHAFPVPGSPFPQPFGCGGRTLILRLALTSRLEPPLGKTTRRLWRPGELA
jgi:hypothetical protein